MIISRVLAKTMDSRDLTIVYYVIHYVLYRQTIYLRCVSFQQTKAFCLYFSSVWFLNDFSLFNLILLNGSKWKFLYLYYIFVSNQMNWMLVLSRWLLKRQRTIYYRQFGVFIAHIFRKTNNTDFNRKIIFLFLNVIDVWCTIFD